MIDWNKIVKKEWCVEHFDGYPQNTEMTASGFTSSLYDYDIPKFSICFCYYKNGQADWVSLVSDQNKIGSYLVNWFMKDKKKFLGLHKKWQQNYKLMKRRYYKLFDQDLAKLTDKNLLKWTENLYYFYRKVISMPGFIDGFMFYADRRLCKLLNNFIKENNLKDTGFFSVLSAAIEPSFINEEEKALCKIAKIYKQGGCNLRKVENLLKKHIQKYSWLKSSYIGYKKYTLEMVLTEMKEILKKNNKDFNNFFAKTKKDKQSLIKKYRFTPEILAIAKLSEILVRWQDQRKEYTLTFNALLEKVREEVSKRTMIDTELLKFSYFKELSKIICGNFSVSDLIKRKNGSLFIYRNGGIAGCLAGEKANKIFHKLSFVDVGHAADIKGLPASLGLAMGVVKIVYSVQDLGKINRGDILVAGMTRPEHLPGMRKAAAIVTDDGGITCHASIISRELGIPCIIGTKIATKVLKDGDLVEVNANHGVVTKCRV